MRNFLTRIDPTRILLEKGAVPGMNVPGLIFADTYIESLLEGENALIQVANVACLPGIAGYSFAMPDIHQGYGFPIGGVAAFDADEGIISPGGVGYDISCGVRLLGSEIPVSEFLPHSEKILASLFSTVPCGIGPGGGAGIRKKDLEKILEEGAARIVRSGRGTAEDLERIEEKGCLEGALTSAVSERAVERGVRQLGTLGSGNHFIEIQAVEEIFGEEEALRMGIKKGCITVMIHCGSRGLGHQVCDDYIKVMKRAMERYRISVPDRQLCCAPIPSPEGRNYLGAMKAAANFAMANRQKITDDVRNIFIRFFPGRILHTVYDVSHNLAHIETHMVSGKARKLCVHRKGATRAFNGLPVLIPGSMGTSSYVLRGTEGAEKETFASACHGAGRLLSRKEASNRTDGRELVKELSSKGIAVMADSLRTLGEEMPGAYKDVSAVVEVVHSAGLAMKTARLRPLAVMKG